MEVRRGDYIRFKTDGVDVTAGKKYEVIGVTGTPSEIQDVTFIDDVGDTHCWEASDEDFEVLGKHSQSKVKRGDYVLFLQDGYGVTAGKPYVIHTFDGEFISFIDNDGDYHYWEYPSDEYAITSNLRKAFSGFGSLEVQIKRLNDNATIPVRAHKTDSGFDLFASEDIYVLPQDTEIIPTGIAIKLPPNMEAQVRPKSGITSRTNLRVQLGTIDNGYRGEIGVIVDNLYHESLLYIEEDSDNGKYRIRTIEGATQVEEELDANTYLIRKGDKIAQLVVQPLPNVHTLTVRDFIDDEPTERGENGYGSTGVRADEERE